MQRSVVVKGVEEYRRSRGVMETIAPHQEAGVELIGLVRNQFEVSGDAARMRLIKLGSMNTRPSQLKLF
jgi:hypothetical protein